MQANTPTPPPATVAGDRDVNCFFSGHQQSPKTGRAAKAERGTPVVEDSSRRAVAWNAGYPAARQDRRDPARLRRRRRMANGVDALVQAMQPSRPHPSKHGIVAQPSGTKLQNRRHAILPTGERRHNTIGTGAFFGHRPNKAPEASDSPPRGLGFPLCAGFRGEQRPRAQTAGRPSERI